MECDRLEWAGAIGSRARFCYARRSGPGAALGHQTVGRVLPRESLAGDFGIGREGVLPGWGRGRWCVPALAAVERGGLVEVDGTVVEALPKGVFRVEVLGGRQVLAHISGPERMRLGRILAGDRVRVSLSPYDPGRGRIIDHHR